MAYTEINYIAGRRGEDGHTIIEANKIIESEIFAGPEAIKEGYERFKAILEHERSDWLLGASVRREFDDTMKIDLVLRIGPGPYWDNQYIKSHPDSKYLKRNGIRSYGK